MKKEENFQIKLPQFEGPFDLLLFFIERDELNIQEISIADIADEFLEYLHHFNELNIELASDFIVVAATLMRIKAKMLLPRPEVDDFGNEIDIQNDLIQKLIEYKKFKQISDELRLLEESRLKQNKRGNILQDLQRISVEVEPGEELSSLSLYKLLSVYNKILLRNKQALIGDHHIVIQYPYTIEKQKEVIAELLLINKKLDYNQINTISENKVQFVYNFLALLEMLQQQLIDIQTGFGYNNFWIQSKTITND